MRSHRAGSKEVAARGFALAGAKPRAVRPRIFTMLSAVRYSWVFGLVLLSGCGTRTCCSVETKPEDTLEPANPDKTKPEGVVMLGSGPGRNMANTTDKGLPDTWSVEEGK